MTTILITFFSSLILTIVIVRTQSLHNKFSMDRDLKGPQKFHTKPVPRIGGVAICVAILIATIISYKDNPKELKEILLFFCSLPAFCIGLAEDLTKNISIRLRLIITATGALFAIYLLNIYINRLDVYGLDWFLTNLIISTIFTAFSITGLANAYNMIDGFNGLSSMVGIITLVALGYIGLIEDDPLIIYLSFSMASAIFGFFLLNYPKGLIFLGDGGAYLIGFWIASISILIVNRHHEISPWFALMVNAYPVVETLFTIYRRKFHQDKSPGYPDGLHFHSLIYRRIIKKFRYRKFLISSNANTAPFLWLFCLSGVVPAIFFRSHTYHLIFFFTVYIASYIWLYNRIINFKKIFKVL